jgi:hypothetical protein
MKDYRQQKKQHLNLREKKKRKGLGEVEEGCR